MDTPNPWIGGFEPRPGARVRLFCFPHAGGGAVEYRSWSESLDERIEVLPVQLPGRETRLGEPAFDELSDLVAALVEAIGPELGPSYAVFGHSMGALVAFELTRELRRRGRPHPAHLFLSGRPSPRYPEPARGAYALPEPEFTEYVREMGGTPEEVLASAELREVFFPTLRADLALCARYSYREERPLDVPITVFGGSRDDERSPELLEEWRRETSARFALHMLAGDHFFVRTARAPLLALLARDLEPLTTG